MNEEAFRIYDFATAPFWISLYMGKILFSVLSVQLVPNFLIHYRENVHFQEKLKRHTLYEFEWLRPAKETAGKAFCYSIGREQTPVDTYINFKTQTMSMQSLSHSRVQSQQPQTQGILIWTADKAVLKTLDRNSGMTKIKEVPSLGLAQCLPKAYRANNFSTISRRTAYFLNQINCIQYIRQVPARSFCYFYQNLPLWNLF